MKKGKQTLQLLILGLVWVILAICAWLKPDSEISVSERRKLEAFPDVNSKNIASGKFSNSFETYALDQFPLRDTFRTVKSVFEFYVFGKKDNNDIYISDGYAAKTEYPLKEDSVQYAVDRMNDIYKDYVEGTGGKVYLSIVPDKGYFMAEKTGHLTIDYKALFDMVKNDMPYAEYIDITKSLELSDYYKTDSHWKQEKIVDAAKELADALGSSISGEYDKRKVEEPFYGVYYGQSALPLKRDVIYYLSNEVLDSCQVYNAETKETTGLYNFEKLKGYDKYEMFLSGATPLITIENSNKIEKKELVVFRDSFASSIVPLLAEGYSKITLVDTRYMQPEMIEDYVDFEDSDVLFLYSTTLLNNSQSMRK